MRKLQNFSFCHAVRLVVLTVLALAGATYIGKANAQTITANISGSVADTTGAVIPNADVVATNVANGFTFKTTSNSAGEYKLRFLPVGSYKVTISSTGFTKQVFGPFALEIGQDAKVDASLKVGGSTTDVEVESDFTPILNTSDNTIATTMSTNAIASMPLNGRNFSALTVYLPGAIETNPGGMTGQNAYERSTNQGGQTSVNGNRNQSNNYYLDGIEINETINNVIGYNPAPDMLGEVKVISANAPAEYGNVNGGDLIAVTKGGTNKYHGSAYYYLENYLLDANSWGNKHASVITPKSHYTRPLFGGTIGGPIIKDKLFFFMDYEGVRAPTAGTGKATVIPNSMRSGDLSSISQQLYNNANNATTGPVAYAGNVISIVNPVAKYLFAHPELYPVENTTPTSGYMYQNYTGITKSLQRNDQGDIRIDWKPTQADTVTARWLQGEAYDNTTPVLAITFPGSNDYPTKGIAINEVHQFSSALVNEFRAGYTRVRWIQGTPVDSTGVFGSKGDSILGIGATQPFSGFASINFSCNSVSGCDSTNDIPSSFGNSYTGTLLEDNTFQYGDNLTWLKGHHTFKGGAEITRYQQNNYYPGNEGANGQFNYYPEYTMNPSSGVAGNPIADFMLDASSAIGQGGLDQNNKVSGQNGQRQYRLGFFVQDDCKYSDDLTFNLGVRYEYDQPIYEVNNKESNLIFGTTNAQTSSQRIEYAGKNGASRALYDPTYTNFMPRVGFNYQPTPKLVVRGGFGITTYLEGTGANLRLTYNAPYWNEVQGTGTLPTTSSTGSFFKVEDGFSSGGSPTLAGSTYRGWNKVKPSVVDEWSLATEYELTNNTNLTVAYVGEEGMHLIQAVAYNQLTTPCAINGSYAAGQTAGATSAACAAVDPSPWYSVVGQNGSVVGTTSEAVMNYNAMQVSLRQHAAKGLEYTVNYTYGHAFTNSVGFFGVSGVSTNSAYAQNAYDNNAEYGPAGWDIRHAFNGDVNYELPFGRGRQIGGNWNRGLDEVAGGWKFTVAGVRYTGFPVTINGTDNSVTGARAARPNHYRTMIIKNRNINQWFGNDPSATGCTTRGADNGICAYGNTSYGTFGDARPATERAPGFVNFDLSLSKDFQIWKDHKISFKADGFNAFNISSYGNPDNGYADSNFGQITSVRSNPRQFQLSTSYSF